MEWLSPMPCCHSNSHLFSCKRWPRGLRGDSDVVQYPNSITSGAVRRPRQSFRAFGHFLDGFSTHCLGDLCSKRPVCLLKGPGEVGQTWVQTGLSRFGATSELFQSEYVQKRPMSIPNAWLRHGVLYSIVIVNVRRQVQ